MTVYSTFRFAFKVYWKVKTVKHILCIQTTTILIKDFLGFGKYDVMSPLTLTFSIFLTFACFLSLAPQFCLLYGTKLLFQERGWYLEHKYLTPAASMRIRAQVRARVQRRVSVQQPLALCFLRTCPCYSVASF